MQAELDIPADIGAQGGADADDLDRRAGIAHREDLFVHIVEAGAEDFAAVRPKDLLRVELHIDIPDLPLVSRLGDEADPGRAAGCRASAGEVFAFRTEPFDCGGKCLAIETVRRDEDAGRIFADQR